LLPGIRKEQIVRIVVVLCCLAAVLAVRALAGPERWHRRVRSQMHPEASEPTHSGYMLLFWRNWGAAVIAVIAVWVTVDHFRLSETELYDASARAVGALDGTSGVVTATRIEAAVEDIVHADLTIEEVTSDDDGRDASSQYEITKKKQTSEDGPAAERVAMCIEVTSRELRYQSGVWYSYTSFSQGPCSR